MVCGTLPQLCTDLEYEQVLRGEGGERIDPASKNKKVFHFVTTQIFQVGNPGQTSVDAKKGIPGIAMFARVCVCIGMCV